MIEKMLSEELENEVLELSKNPTGTKEYETNVTGICEMMKTILEERKIRQEETLAYEKLQMEQEMKEKELANNKKAQYLDIACKFIVGALGVGAAVWGTIYTTNFEKDDNYSTTASRNWIASLLKPRK